MSILSIVEPLLASNSQLVSPTPPNYVQLFMGSFLALCTGLLLFMAQGERERRRRERDVKEKNDEQMAAVNQSLALLLNKQSETTADLSEQSLRIRALETQQSAYDVSLALLKQEIHLHVATSEEDRRRLHDNISAVRDGLTSNRRSVERDKTRS